MSENILEEYAKVAGDDVIHHLRQLAEPLKGLKIVHVNSTKQGGGVAEILQKLIPLKRALGIDASWEIITGEGGFYQTTKGFHNALQGKSVHFSEAQLDEYERTNMENAEKLKSLLEEADVAFIHDPQPAPLLEYTPNRKGKWVWRCHIDVSRPHRQTWKYISNWVKSYDASVFSLPEFSQRLPHIQYLIPPSIDPLSEKNMDLDENEVKSVFDEFGLNPDLPMVIQVSRFDQFKDPLGVIEAYRIAKKLAPLQLVLCGGTATDDPEGEAVLADVRHAAEDDPDIHILLLPPDSHRKINALQRASDIVIQKSTREGFGLTVTEGMWKSKPVIGGDTGGIRLQVIDHYTGFLVRTPEGAALRMRYLLNNRGRLERMGQTAHEYVKENFLLTRHLREYLTLIISLIRGEDERIELMGNGSHHYR